MMATTLNHGAYGLDCAPRRSREHVQRWMLGPEGWTIPVCEIDLRPDGAWHFLWRRANGTQMEMRGVYREIAPPERLVSTESRGGKWPETLNTLLLSGTARRR